jgi:hypothetical protein
VTCTTEIAFHSRNEHFNKAKSSVECSIDFACSVANGPAIEVTLFMKHSKNIARILSYLSRKKLGKTQYIPKWKRGTSVMLCRMQEQTDHICQDATVS